MAQSPRLTVGKVFVAGGQPTITYSPRDQYGLEHQVLDYLDERHRILSVSGQTKTGKTVLIHNVLKDQDAIFVSGGTVTCLGDLWAQVADHLSLSNVYESTYQSTDIESRTVGGDIQLPGVVKLSGTGQESASVARSDKTGRTRPVELAARKALRSTLPPLIIDDFHYIDQSVQTQIVRALKDLVFDGLPVIVISVPHRAYDVARVEKEMTGRVEQMRIDFWSNDELRMIGQRGFEALNLIDEANAIGDRLAVESFASPYLMQDFCLQVVKGSGFRERQDIPSLLVEPQWQPFFHERAAAASKTAFDLLATGPRQRTDRKSRVLNDGLVVDIYGAVLMAISHTGPLVDLPYETLRSSLKEIIKSDLPQRHEVTRILDEMSKIARKAGGEPVVDYDSELSTLHISDPYFAFFLKWRASTELSKRSTTIDIMFPGSQAMNPVPERQSPPLAEPQSVPKLRHATPLAISKHKYSQPQRRRKGRR